MNDLIQKINEIGIVPVVKLNRVEDAIPLAGALMKGGSEGFKARISM